MRKMSPFRVKKMADYCAVEVWERYSYLRNEAIIRKTPNSFWSHQDTKSVSMSSMSLSYVSRRWAAWTHKHTHTHSTTTVTLAAHARRGLTMYNHTCTQSSASFSNVIYCGSTNWCTSIHSTRCRLREGEQRLTGSQLHINGHTESVKEQPLSGQIIDLEYRSSGNSIGTKEERKNVSSNQLPHVITCPLAGSANAPGEQNYVNSHHTNSTRSVSISQRIPPYYYSYHAHGKSIRLTHVYI